MCQRKRLSFLNFIESLETGSLKFSSNLEKFYHFFKYFYLSEYLCLLILVLQLFISYMACFCPVNHWGSAHFFQRIFALQFEQMLLYCFYFFKLINLYFIFGCAGSSVQHAGFSLRWLLLLRSTGSRHTGFSSCGSWALERRLSSCGTRT